MAVEPFIYHICDNIDFVFEERGNQFSALRKIKWGSSDKAYLEVRRWNNTPDGGEMAGKGMTFLTEEGPHELVDVLTKLGYGNTKEILQNLQIREDFRKSLNTVLGSNDEFFDEQAGTLEDDYYDPKEILNME